MLPAWYVRFLPHVVGAVAIAAAATSLYIKGRVDGAAKWKERATLAQQTLNTERAQHQQASDAALADRKAADARADALQAQFEEARKVREAERLSQDSRERDLRARIGSMRNTESSLRTAALNASAGFAAQLDGARTSAEQLGVCRSLVERGNRLTSGLVTFLVQDRAEGRRAIADRQDALDYIAAARARCETTNSVKERN